MPVATRAQLLHQPVQNGADMMNTRTVLAVSIAAAATTLTQPAIANAEPYSGYEFMDPSKNIWCAMRLYTDGENSAQCDIDKHNFAGPASDAAGSCPQTEGYIFMLREAGAPEISCLHGSVIGSINYVLDYGQQRTEGAITCDSELSGMTCTNTTTGHFYRVSRDSYQVG